MTHEFDFDAVLASFDRLLQGALLTVELSAAAIVLGLAVGVLGAFAKTSGGVTVRALVSAYVEIIRNTPFLVQLYLIFFGLPALGVKLGANEAALLAMTVNLGAYATEILRAGVEAIPKTQIEAGTALGLSPLQIFRYVILVPALETVYPALTSQFTLIMLASSVVGTISANELSSMASLIDSETFRSFETYLVVTPIYIALAFMFRGVFLLVSRAIFRRRRRLQGVFGFGGAR
ncbi:MAG: amino acid ABC transporter permease [Hyphomicrobiales bacterium]|nr:amino acid ABC transporter permease [Hyphomicrobiales bacterium]